MSRYESLPPDMRFHALRAFVDEQTMVSAGESAGGLERGYLVQPTRAVLKFIHNDDPDDKIGPMFEAFFEVFFFVLLLCTVKLLCTVIYRIYIYIYVNR